MTTLQAVAITMLVGGMLGFRLGYLWPKPKPVKRLCDRTITYEQFASMIEKYRKERFPFMKIAEDKTIYPARSALGGFKTHMTKKAFWLTLGEDYEQEDRDK